MEELDQFGKVYTTSKHSYRGKAEQRQREYRVHCLRAGYGEYGHLLDEKSAAVGKNFILAMSHEAARKRDITGKGVGKRTFANMLSSQAMCFNIFEPLNADKKLCQQVLSHFFPDIAFVNSIVIEYTPEYGIFQDQSGKGGVDCDVLIEAAGSDGKPVVILIETKFVEPEFSTCGYRKPRPKNSKLSNCSDGIRLKGSINNCLYVANKKPPYLYWQRTMEHGLLRADALPSAGCPFSGAIWQLWVNYALAHEEAKHRKATRAYYAVCASVKNTRLLTPEHNALDKFQSLVVKPDRIKLLDIDALLEVIKSCIASDNNMYCDWIEDLLARYANI